MVSSMYDIRNQDKKEIIKKIVSSVTQKALAKAQSTNGLDKYIAYELMYEIRSSLNSVYIYYINLEEITEFDHSSIIAEYKEDVIQKRLLIDPTFSQFIDTNTNNLIIQRPNNNGPLNEELIKNLKDSGVVEVNDKVFNDYINMFSQRKINYDIEDYLVYARMGRTK